MAASLALPKERLSPDRIVDVNINAVPGGAEDAQRAWRALGDRHQLVWTPQQEGHWIATSGAVIEQVYRATEQFASFELSVPPDRFGLKLLPNAVDGEMHTALRAIIDPVFRLAAVQGYSIKARQLAIDLIEEFRPRGGCEFVSEFSLVMPLSVFLWLVDLPLEDRPMLQAWAHTGTRGTPEEARAAFGEMVGYLSGWLEERRKRPGDDLLSRIVHGRIGDRALTSDEILGTSLLLLFAGLDTVAMMMAFVMHHLAGNPAARRWILDHPTQVSFAAEELMRRHGVANNVRTATEDVEIDGVTIHKGERVLLPNCIHGMDERQFVNPSEIDFDRKLGQTGTFGWGPHRCAGANLARMEMRLLLQEWLPRIPDFDIDPSRPVRQTTGQVNGFSHLPLRWPFPPDAQSSRIE